MEEVYKYVDSNFQTKTDTEEFKSKTQENVIDFDKKIDNLNKYIELMKDSLYNKITRDVKKATAHLRNSVLQDDAEGSRRLNNDETELMSLIGIQNTSMTISSSR